MSLRIFDAATSLTPGKVQVLSVILVENVSGDKGYPITLVPMPLSPLFDDDGPAPAGPAPVPPRQQLQAGPGTPSAPARAYPFPVFGCRSPSVTFEV